MRPFRVGVRRRARIRRGGGAGPRPAGGGGKGRLQDELSPREAQVLALIADADQAVLWDALRAGDIQTVATDHVGYAMVEKYHAGDTFAMVPPGMSNLETLLPMLYSEGVGKGRITIERFVELIATNPA